MKPEIALDQACRCYHPLHSGRWYMGREACLRCDLFLTHRSHVARMRHTAEKQREAELNGRKPAQHRNRREVA